MPLENRLMAMQFLTSKIGFVAVAQSAWSAGARTRVRRRDFRVTQDGGLTWSTYALPSGLTVTGIDFRSARTGLIVGKTPSAAFLYSTADGGKTWKARASTPLTVKPYRQSYDTVHLAGTFGYALLDGRPLVSTDGGVDWSPLRSPGPLNDIVFLNDRQVVAIGDQTVWRTADGGAQWRSVFTLNPIYFVPDSKYLSNSQIDQPYGLAASAPSGVNLVTSSGNAVWAVFNSGSACAMPHCLAYVVQFTKGVIEVLYPQIGSSGSPPPVLTQAVATSGGLYAAGPGYSGQTLDLFSPFPIPPIPGSGGLRIGMISGWAPISPQLTLSGPQIGAVSQDAEGGLWVALSDATLLHRPAGAKTWAQVWPNLRPSAIQFVSASRGYGVGTEAGTPVLLTTRDGGSTWRAVHSFPGLSVTDFAFTSGGVGYLVATLPAKNGETVHGEILRSTDGGVDWSVQREIGDGSGWLTQVDLQALSRQTIRMAVTSLHTSTNAGKNWSRTDRLPAFAKGLAAVDFANPSDGWALGRAGLLYRTTDGGQRWSRLGNLPRGSLADMDFLTAKAGWIITAHAGSRTLLRTTDGGRTWLALSLPASSALLPPGPSDRQISFVSARVGYLIGASGLYKTTDAGSRWQPVN